MHCPGCQHENREGRRFCSKCGAALAMRSRGSRGSCGSCLLCRDPHAAPRQPLRRRDPARGRHARADPRGPQFGRGCRALDRQRPPHGLHRGRADHASRSPDGADGQAGIHARHGRHRDAGGGLHPGSIGRGRPREGAGDPGARLRAYRLRASPVPAPSQRWARSDPVRGARVGATPARTGARSRRLGPRASSRGRGRTRRGRVAAGLGVHAIAPYPRLAHDRERLGLLREGHAVLARHRAAEGVFRRPGAR
jgi:hypothetical protein